MLLASRKRGRRVVGLLAQPLDAFQRIHIETSSITDLRLAEGAIPFIAGVNGREVTA